MSLVKTMEKFKLGAPLKELFQRSADSFALSSHDTLVAEIARKGCIADQFVAAFGILRKVPLYSLSFVVISATFANNNLLLSFFR